MALEIMIREQDATKEQDRTGTLSIQVEAGLISARHRNSTKIKYDNKSAISGRLTNAT